MRGRSKHKQKRDPAADLETDIDASPKADSQIDSATPARAKSTTEARADPKPVITENTAYNHQATPLRPAQRSADTAAFTRLCQHLEETPANVVRLSEAIISQAMDEMKMRAKDRAKCALAMLQLRPLGDGSRELAAAVDATRLQKVFPWIPKEDKAKRHLLRFAEEYRTPDPWSRLRETYVARAKADTLGPLEALVGQYLLYTQDNDYGRFLLMSLLLHTPVPDRLILHNWAIAQELGQVIKESYGSHIELLPSPLYPPNSGLDAYNLRLLDATSKSTAFPREHSLQPSDGLPSGGNSCVPFVLGGMDPAGDGWLGVTQNAEGQYGVDTTTYDTALQNHFGTAIEKLSDSVAKMKKQLDTQNKKVTKTKLQQQQQLQQQSLQQQPYYQQQQPPATHLHQLPPGYRAPPPPPPPPYNQNIQRQPQNRAARFGRGQAPRGAGADNTSTTMESPFTSVLPAQQAMTSGN